ncbi:MAG: bifunctional adenosylcobinamide kinase/adenosylcobinamide-phosphate guanylyltransferase [Rhizobiaceae bacterium]
MPDNPNLTLVIGGARSGKSSHGERLIEAHAPPWIYVATAQALDEEMKQRISAHQKRRDERWKTIEAPLDLVSAMEKKSGDRPVLIDCLTLWLTNHLMNGADLRQECLSLQQTLSSRAGPTVVITNEVGQGIVPADAMTREFRDAAGRLNQMIASVSGSVVQMVAGIAVKVK